MYSSRLVSFCLAQNSTVNELSFRLIPLADA